MDITYKCLPMHEGKKMWGPVINESQLTKEALLPSEPKIEETNGPPGPLDSSGPSMYALRPRSEVDICHIAGCK